MVQYQPKQTTLMPHKLQFKSSSFYINSLETFIHYIHIHAYDIGSWKQGNILMTQLWCYYTITEDIFQKSPFNITATL